MSIYDLDRDGLGAHLAGEPRFRVDQLWRGLYSELRRPGEMTNLPAALRARLERELPAGLTETLRSTTDDGDTTKFLWALGGGVAIETVLMLYPDRATVCVSSQAGCAMACGFCATGQAGFDRQLSAGEIIEQVVVAARVAADDPRGPRRVSNIVFMGMGEPMANYDAVWTAVERLHCDIGISARHLTISTVGIIPGIRRLATEALPVNLAVSLHAANDDKRNELVPVNRRYPLDALANACADYLAAKGRRLSFEWAMIDGVNDTAADAVELAAYATRLRAHVNLIPLNSTPGYPVRGSAPAVVQEFRDRLVDLGTNATIRANRGNEIDAACGQLRANHEITVAVSPPGPRR